MSQAGESGIVVLRADALAADSDSEAEDARPPSPLSVRFVNDNVLINGRSSLAPRLAPKDRAARAGRSRAHTEAVAYNVHLVSDVFALLPRRLLRLAGHARAEAFV
ncbi:jg9935 [Pararge aegeria aegeria]|uniref:Jg9935 protein n=1 Tax=Pararge aegeria aegeria TaxID=348720 RepID=A0A8S4S5Q1_9NEOP|nr:jg9935 [Pararge aegeria aegeria]